MLCLKMFMLKIVLLVIIKLLFSEVEVDHHSLKQIAIHVKK